MLKHLLFCSVIGVVLLSCGFKGPLYLPNRPQTATTSPAVNTSHIRNSASSIKVIASGSKLNARTAKMHTNGRLIASATEANA
ncbi:MAG: lipoprotein [Burkholderiales bacterium]